MATSTTFTRFHYITHVRPMNSFLNRPWLEYMWNAMFRPMNSSSNNFQLKFIMSDDFTWTLISIWDLFLSKPILTIFNLFSVLKLMVGSFKLKTRLLQRFKTYSFSLSLLPFSLFYFSSIFTSNEIRKSEFPMNKQ